MPFPQQQALSYTKSGIEILNPNQNGCYGIFRQNACIYIGRGDLRTRLLAHVNGDNPDITRQFPTFALTVVTNDDVNEEKRLILEYRPIANKKLG